MTARNHPTAAVPGWVFAGVLFIGLGWLVFLCGAAGLTPGPVAATTKPARPAVRPDPTPTDEK